mgnify:CR=1 FL=1
MSLTAAQIVTAYRIGVFPMAESRVGRLFDGHVNIQIELAETLTSPSGKHCYVISAVANERLEELLRAP